MFDSGWGDVVKRNCSASITDIDLIFIEKNQSVPNPLLIGMDKNAFVGIFWSTGIGFTYKDNLSF